MTKHFVSDFPSDMVSDELKSEALDIVFHWVNETGELAKLSSGISVQPTVRHHICLCVEAD